MINEKLIEKNIITLNVPDVNPISITTAYQPANVTSGYTLNNSVGTKLTLNNGVKIGKGVSKVKISTMIKLYNNDGDTNVYLLYIIKNGGSMNNTYSSIAPYYFATEILPSYVLDVQENDVITVGLSCSKTISTSRLFSGYLTVEVIK